MELQTLQIHIRITHKDINKLSRLQNSVKYVCKICTKQVCTYIHTYYATQDIHIIQCNNPHMISYAYI